MRLAAFHLSEAVSTDPDINEAEWLIHNGRTEESAYSLPAGIRHGLVVIHARFEGSEFDYRTKRWKKPKPS